MPGHPPVTSAPGPQLLTECQDIFQPDKPSSPFGKREMDSHLVKIRMVTAPRHTTWKSVLLLSCFMMPWILFSSLTVPLSFFAWAIPLKLSYCSCISIPASCLSTSFSFSALHTALRPFPFRGHCVFCAGSTKSTCWHWFLGTDINILLTTAQPAEGSLLTFHPLGECFTDYTETMSREKG